MMISDELRDKFNSDFDYTNIEKEDLQVLAMFLDSECANHYLHGDHTKFWVSKIKFNKDENGSMQSVFIRVSGTYFNNREAVSFNGDGFIGFCGWADSINSEVIYRGFLQWLAYLREKWGIEADVKDA